MFVLERLPVFVLEGSVFPCSFWRGASSRVHFGASSRVRVGARASSRVHFGASSASSRVRVGASSRVHFALTCVFPDFPVFVSETCRSLTLVQGSSVLGLLNPN